jgi:hypothetical protein
VQRNDNTILNQIPSKIYTCPNDTTFKVWLVPIISTMGEIKGQHVANIWPINWSIHIEHHTKLSPDFPDWHTQPIDWK